MRPSAGLPRLESEIRILYVQMEINGTIKSPFQFDRSRIRNDEDSIPSNGERIKEDFVFNRLLLFPSFLQLKNLDFQFRFPDDVWQIFT